MTINYGSRAATPWGEAQAEEFIADGITLYSTASHGGMRLSAERLAAMPALYRKTSPLNKATTSYCPEPWFEEDCEVALVICAFPESFRPEEVEAARRDFDYWYALPA